MLPELRASSGCGWMRLGETCCFWVVGGENLNLIIFVVIPGSLRFDFLPLGGVAMVLSLSAMFMSGGGFEVARKGWESTVMVERVRYGRLRT